MTARQRLVTAAAIVALSLAALPVRAASDDAAGVISDLADRARAMRSDTLTPDAQQQQFRAVLAEDFDFQSICKKVLGRYWTLASDAERQQFASAFENYLVKAYSERFKDFTAVEIKVTRQRGEGAEGTIISTDIIQEAGAPPFAIDWRLGKTGQGYKITDVSIAGISLTETQREEFAAVIQRNGGQVSGLIQQLVAKTTATAAAPTAEQTPRNARGGRGDAS